MSFQVRKIPHAIFWSQTVGFFSCLALCNCVVCQLLESEYVIDWCGELGIAVASTRV